MISFWGLNTQNYDASIKSSIHLNSSVINPSPQMEIKNDSVALWSIFDFMIWSHWKRVKCRDWQMGSVCFPTSCLLFKRNSTQWLQLLLVLTLAASDCISSVRYNNMLVLMTCPQSSVSQRQMCWIGGSFFFCLWWYSRVHVLIWAYFCEFTLFFFFISL